MKLSLVPIVLLSAGCSPSQLPEQKFIWESRCDELVADRYQACYGPGWEAPGSTDRPYENFQVSLERINSRGSDVLLRESFESAEVPRELLVRYPPSVVLFNRESGKVIFSVGEKRVVGYVPPPAP